METSATSEPKGRLIQELEAIGVCTLGWDWTQRAPTAEQLAFQRLRDVELARLDGRPDFGRPTLREATFFLERLPADDQVFAMLADLVHCHPACVKAVPDGRKHLRYQVHFTREQAPAFFDRGRGLRWAKVAVEARRDGFSLPFLLEGDRFSLQGWALHVKALGRNCVDVELLDEHNEGVAWASMFSDGEPGPEPLPRRVKAVPKGARSRVRLLLALVGD